MQKHSNKSQLVFYYNAIKNRQVIMVGKAKNLVKGKIYKYVYHYANLYRISIKINNKDIVKTVPDRFTKTQVRIAITTLMRENGLNEAHISKAMEGWGEEREHKTRHVKFPTKVNQTGYLGVSHNINTTSGHFICQHNREVHDKFTYPIRQFLEGVFWIKEKEMLNAYEQACNSSDIKRYGVVGVAERSYPKNNFLREIRKKTTQQVHQVIVANSITTLIKKINSNKNKLENITNANVTGHKLIHPHITEKRIGYQVTSTSKPEKNEIFAVQLTEFYKNNYIANSSELDKKFTEACAYADDKFGFTIKTAEDYLKLKKKINWPYKLLNKSMSENVAKTKPKISFYSENDPEKINKFKKGLLRELLPEVKPYCTENEVGYTFEINNKHQYLTTALKKISGNNYWAHPNKVLQLFLEAHKQSTLLFGLTPISKAKHKAKNSETEWLTIINKHFETQNNNNSRIKIHLTKTISELRQKIKNEEDKARLINERQKLLDENEAALKKISNLHQEGETGHKDVYAKIVYGHAIYYIKSYGKTIAEKKIKLSSVKNSNFTISREKLLNAFVYMCRKADHFRNIKNINDEQYKLLYKDINWIDKARTRNKRFKSIKVID